VSFAGSIIPKTTVAVFSNMLVTLNNVFFLKPGSGFFGCVMDDAAMAMTHTPKPENRFDHRETDAPGLLAQKTLTLAISGSTGFSTTCVTKVYSWDSGTSCLEKGQI